MSDVSKQVFSLGEVFAFVFNCNYFAPGKNGSRDVFKFMVSGRECNSESIVEAMKIVAVCYIRHLYPDVFSESVIFSTSRFFSKVIGKKEYPDWLKEEEAVKFIKKISENHGIAQIELRELPEATLLYINNKLEKRIEQMRGIASLVTPPFIGGRVLASVVEFDVEEIKKTF